MHCTALPFRLGGCGCAAQGRSYRRCAIQQEADRGRFDRATASTITVEENGSLVPLNRDQVVRLYTRPKINRLARIAIGAGIGAVGGAALDASAGQRFRNEGREIGGALYGAGIGAGAAIGAASGGGYKTLYQATGKPTTAND